MKNMMKEKLLVEATNNLFKNNPNWQCSCIDQPDQLILSNLPCHLRDNEWLAKVLKRYFKLAIVSYNDILEYVQTSQYFQNMRHAYELKIVNEQIKYIETDVICKGYEEDFFIYNENCDLIFREAILSILMAIGMEKEVIEEGLEANASLWRENYMLRAFHNQNTNPNIQNLESCPKEYQDMWLQLREYEYYQQHKDVVDKYGSKTAAMFLSDIEAEALKNRVLEEQRKRQQYIHQMGEDIKNGKINNTMKFNLEVSEQEFSVKPFLFEDIMSKPIDTSNPIVIEINARKKVRFIDRIRSIF